MDSNKIIVWSIIILTSVSLIAYIQLRKRAKEKKIFSLLQSFCLENGGTISSYDHWDKTLIGLDEKGGSRLFFIRKIANVETRKIINLKEIKNSRIVKDAHSEIFEKEKVSVIEKINLVFTYIDANRPQVALEFYNSDFDHLTITVELQLAEKWSKIVNEISASNAKPEKKEKSYKHSDTNEIQDNIGRSQKKERLTSRAQTLSS